MSDWHAIVYKLGPISKLPNSDNLELTTVMGEYPVVIRKDQFKEGQLVSWIPYDSVCPNTKYFEFLQTTKKDKAGNVTVVDKPIIIKSRRLRGTYSEGLILEAPPGFKEGDSVVDFYGLTKRVYEEEKDELQKSMNRASGQVEKSPKTFKLFKYDLEGLAKYSSHFQEGEEVIIFEKLEGENFSCTYAEGKLWVRSRNLFKRNGERPYFRKHQWLKKAWYEFKEWLNPPKNTEAFSYWWEVPVRFNLEEKLKKYPYLTIWGELYGGIKGWYYDCETVDGSLQRKVRIFDIYDIKNKKFLEWEEVERITKELGLETSPILYRGPWKSDRSLHDLAEGKSTIGDCVREGWVMRSVPESYSEGLGRKIVKLKGRDYKLAKN
jgi:RNA ligase (TIGR02306 family)